MQFVAFVRFTWLFVTFFLLCWLFCSAGLSPDLANMEQIRRIMRPTDVPDSGMLT